MVMVLITFTFCGFCIGAVFNYCKRAYQRRRNGNQAIANNNVQQQWRANFVANGNILDDDVFADDDDDVPIQMEEFLQQEEMRRPLAIEYGNRTQPNDLLRFPPDEDLDEVTVV